MNKEEIKTYLKNISEGIKIINNIINNQDINVEFKNEIIESILNHHPKFNEKNIEYLQYLKIKLNMYKKKGLYIKTTYNEEEEISYKKCVENLFERYNIEDDKYDKTVKAFRNGINHGYRHQYFLENIENKNGVCDNCKLYCEVDIDHYQISFQKIFDSFIKFKCITLDNFEIEDINNILYIKDIDIKQSWLKFHDSIVEYRLLCRSCNGSFGSYGYKSDYSKNKKENKEEKKIYYVIICNTDKVKNGVYDKWDNSFSYAQIKQKYDNEEEAMKFYEDKIKEIDVDKKKDKRIYLKIPFSEKDEIKKFGGIWDVNEKKWNIMDNNINKKILLEKYNF